MVKKVNLYEKHRFLDESGDTAFHGKSKTDVIGMTASKCFILRYGKI